MPRFAGRVNCFSLCCILSRAAAGRSLGASKCRCAFDRLIRSRSAKVKYPMYTQSRLSGLVTRRQTPSHSIETVPSLCSTSVLRKGFLAPNKKFTNHLIGLITGLSFLFTLPMLGLSIPQGQGVSSAGLRPSIRGANHFISKIPIVPRCRKAPLNLSIRNP